MEGNFFPFFPPTTPAPVSEEGLTGLGFLLYCLFFGGSTSSSCFEVGGKGLLAVFAEAEVEASQVGEVEISDKGEEGGTVGTVGNAGNGGRDTFDFFSSKKGVSVIAFSKSCG